MVSNGIGNLDQQPKPHVALANYYRIKAHQTDLRQMKPKTMVCNICFEVGCCGKHPTASETNGIKATEAAEILGYWADVALMESKKTHLERDELTIPKWPDGSGKRGRVNYVVYPALALPLTVIHRENDGESYAYFENGKVNTAAMLYGKKTALGNGSHWGYFYRNTFYLLRAFRNGKWCDLKRVFPKLPNADEITAESALGKLLNGFWYIPVVERYDLFWEYLYRV